MNSLTIAPHGPPVQGTTELPSSAIRPGPAFDQFLPDQPAADAPDTPGDDVPAAPGGGLPVANNPPNDDIRMVHPRPMLPPPGDELPESDDPPVDDPAILLHRPMLFPPGKGKPDAVGSPTGNQGTTTPTDLVGPPLMQPTGGVDDSDSLPSMLMTGPIQPTFGKASSDGSDSPDASGETSTEPMPMRPMRHKEIRRTAADAIAPDAAIMAAQLPALVDLRSMVPAVTLTPSLTPTVAATQDEAGAASNAGGKSDLGVVASVGGGNGQTARTDTPPNVANSAVGTWAMNQPPSAIAPREMFGGPVSEAVSGAAPTAESSVPGASGGAATTSTSDLASAAVGTVQDILPAATSDPASLVAVTDSRLAAPPPAAEVQINVTSAPETDGAKVADSNRSKDQSVRFAKNSASQVADTKQDVTGSAGDGMPVAKNAVVVNATRSFHENAAAADASPRRDGRTATAAVAPGRTGAGRAPDSEVLINAAVAGAASVDPATAQITGATANAAPTPTRHAVNVETLLQNALGAGESLRPNGRNEMEMRVRLGGGAEDVVVRMQVTNDRMQVTFRTDSPELRRALEHGWQQFSSTASQTSTLALDRPRFEASRFDALPGGSSENAAFSSNQQNSHQRESGTMSGDDFAPATARSTNFNPPSITASPADPSPDRRWNRWA